MLSNVSNVLGLVILNEHSWQVRKQHPKVFNLFQKIELSFRQRLMSFNRELKENP